MRIFFSFLSFQPVLYLRHRGADWIRASVCATLLEPDYTRAQRRGFWRALECAFVTLGAKGLRINVGAIDFVYRFVLRLDGV